MLGTEERALSLTHTSIHPNSSKGKRVGNRVLRIYEDGEIQPAWEGGSVNPLVNYYNRIPKTPFYSTARLSHFQTMSFKWKVCTHLAILSFPFFH